MRVLKVLRIAGPTMAGALWVTGLPSSALAAQPPSLEPWTLATAIAGALAANPDIAAARLGRAVNVAGLSVAGERPNPEASLEIEKETPKQSFALAWP